MKYYAPYSCANCHGTGLVLAIRKQEISEAPYAFKCDCPRGDRNLRNYPFWDSSRLKDFQIVSQGQYVEVAS